MKSIYFRLSGIAAVGILTGWGLAGFRGAEMSQTSEPAPARKETSRFVLSHRDLSPLPATTRPGRDFKGAHLIQGDAAALIEKADSLLDSPDALLALSGRLELGETLAAIAAVDPGAALALAARLPNGDLSSPILDHLATALIESRGAEAVGLVASLANAARRHECMQHLMAAMALEDPASAFAVGLEHGLFRDARGLHLLFLSWGESDPLAAADALARLPFANQRNESSIALAAAWARKDPQAAMLWAGKLSPSTLRERCEVAALEQFTLSDPASALAAASKAAPMQVAGYLSTVFSTWSRIDPAAAASAARALPEGRQRDQALAALGASVARKDPAMAAALLDDIRPGPQAHALASSMAADWAEIDAPATLRWIETLSESLREKALESSLARLAMNAPEQAAEFAERATATPALADQIGFIASSLAAKDPAAAMEWAGRFESETSATQIRQATLLAWSSTDPVAALRAAVKLETKDRDSLIAQVAAQWAAVDPKATLEWARGVEGDLGLAARGKALEAMAAQDPGLARDEIEKLLNESGGDPALTQPVPHTQHPLTESTAAVVRELAAADPRAATEWARALPDGAIRREVLSRHYTDWATADPAAAVKYAEGNLEGWDRDWTLVSALFRQTESSGTYQEAMDLAPRIQDPGERARAVRLLRNSMVAPANWRRQLMDRGFTAAEIDAAGD